MDDFWRTYGFSYFFKYIGAKPRFFKYNLQIIILKTSNLFEINKAYLWKTKYMVYPPNTLVYFKIRLMISVNK